MRLAASALAVTLVTLLIVGLKSFIPALSLGSLYVFAVLPVAMAWGLAYALPVSVASMLAFNWFFLPPVHSFTLSDSRNWAALVVYLVIAIATSALATTARRRQGEAEQREREAGALARLATALLRGRDVDEEIQETSRSVEEVLGVTPARIETGPQSAPRAGEVRYPLEAGGQEVGAVVLPEVALPELAVRERFLPALASLLGVAVERERLVAEAIEASALRRSDAIKTAVIRAVSHDLRTPLATIEMALDGLDSPQVTLDDDDRRELLASIRAEHERLERLVDNLLDLSRLDAGSAQPSKEIWTPEQLLAGALSGLPGAGRVEVREAAEAPPVLVDGAQVERALANVVENALKYSPAAERVVVRVTATRQEAIIRVVDHGQGLEPGDLDRIFEAFHRAPSAGARPGAGLGLAIARGFVEVNDGRIWAESQPGQGTTVAIALPLAGAAVLERAGAGGAPS